MSQTRAPTPKHDTSEIAQGASLVLGLINMLPDGPDYQEQISRLICALWGVLRIDPFPDDVRALAQHIAGAPSGDGEAMIDRIVSYPKTDQRRMN